MDFVLAWTDLCLIFQLWNASLKANIFFFYFTCFYSIGILSESKVWSQQSFQKSF